MRLRTGSLTINRVVFTDPSPKRFTGVIRSACLGSSHRIPLHLDAMSAVREPIQECRRGDFHQGARSLGRGIATGTGEESRVPVVAGFLRQGEDLLHDAALIGCWLAQYEVECGDGGHPRLRGRWSPTKALLRTLGGLHDIRMSPWISGDSCGANDKTVGSRA